ncbi:hypothetical protein Tco_1466366 [Tanacetum coccineum]
MHHHQGYHHPCPYQFLLHHHHCYYPLFASRREDRPEVTLPPRKRADYGFVATMDREIRRDPERDVGYGITDSWDEIVETLQGAPVSTNTELGRHMTAFETRVRQDTDEIYTRLDDEQSQRQLLAGWLNMLFRDRRAHAYTRHLMETEARLSREAWRRSMDASDLAMERLCHCALPYWSRHEWQRQAADDLAVQHIMRTQALEAGARVDTLEDTGSSS